MFIRLDTKLVEQARTSDIITFLEKRCGVTFAHRGNGYRCKQHPSLAVDSNRLSWYWHSKGFGGYGALDYLIKVEGLSFREAVEAVTNVPSAAPINQNQPPKSLLLPEKAGLVQSRLYDYLCRKRGIDSEIVGALLADGSIYEDRRGNVVFVGYDEAHTPRFASLRGTYGDCRFRMDCAGSDKRYGFHMTYSQSERLYIFESPIDAMSHASLNKTEWRSDNRLSLAGTSDTAMPKYLEYHSNINELVLCLDNDPSGREASAAIARKYTERVYSARILQPQGKDFNDDLIVFRTEQLDKSERMIKWQEKSR